MEIYDKEQKLHFDVKFAIIVVKGLLLFCILTIPNLRSSEGKLITLGFYKESMDLVLR